MEGKYDRSFRYEQEHEGHETDAESDAGQGRQGESIDHPSRSNNGGEKHIRDLQHLGKSFAEMLGQHLQTNDLQNKLRTNCDKEIDGPSCQYLYQAMRSLTTGRLIRYGSHRMCHVANWGSRSRLLLMQSLREPMVI